ncbi:hypothetical protein OSB04_021081 [Centaurea solstitialis]|uniref:Uncharacterized protein n=1 Tax=Centaurea solstitialis TaxID=347529 RepID=A0AA38T186_9ASTR|nr:hypothetical protein OSB04_021081 [Centaurea solstitialis]
MIVSRWGLRREIDSGLGIRRNKDEPFRVANPNVTIASGRSKKEVSMVDPVEAKRLAAKQMVAIKANNHLRVCPHRVFNKILLQRRRQIEAINGAWAMLGLTAGLVIEGQTGHGILAQVIGWILGGRGWCFCTIMHTDQPVGPTVCGQKL